MKPLALISALFAMLSVVRAAESRTVLPLWPEGAPGALGKDDKDKPTLTVYPAVTDKPTGGAMVICPGGGYGGLASYEG